MNVKPITSKLDVTLDKAYSMWASKILTGGWYCAGAALYCTANEVITATQNAREMYEYLPDSYVAIGRFKDAYLILTPDGGLWRLGSKFRSLNITFEKANKRLK